MQGIVPLTTETALLSCIKQAREDVLTLRHLQLLHQNRWISLNRLHFPWRQPEYSWRFHL